MILFLLIVGLVSSINGVLITEIMYHPRDYEDFFEYVEFYNDATVSVDVSGWTVDPLDYKFPANTVIFPRKYIVLSCNIPRLLQAYTFLRPAIVFGPWNQTASPLKNSGDKIKLIDTSGVSRASVSYSDSAPWSPLADGFGSSLELKCYDSNRQNDPTAWSASPVPEHNDSHVEYGGSPGKINFWISCASSIPTTPSIIFSELMYHPVSSIAVEEQHEFLEIYNNATGTIDISDWRIVSGSTMRFRFPLNTRINSGAYVVIAKNISAVSSVYRNIPGKIFGPYLGELSNGNEKVVIVDTNGLVVDFISYDDSHPWPVSADALGCSLSCLPSDSPFHGNYSHYTYRGESLSRRSLTWPTNSVYNWDSKYPSPGVSNLDTGILLPGLSKITLKPEPKDIMESDSVTITFSLKPWPIEGLTVTSASIEYFNYNPITGSSKNFQTQSINLVKDKFTGIFDPQPVNTIRRYRITIKFSDGRKIISPSQKDPFRWFSYFVSPPSDPTTDTYHLFVKPDDWNTIFKNSDAGVRNNRVEGANLCFIRDAWDKQVPGVLVYHGQVVDMEFRLQGSRWNRANGVTISPSDWNHNGPSGGTLRAWSYRFKLPTYSKINGAGIIFLSKMFQGCTMYQTPLMNDLNKAVGVAASNWRFVRLNAQGHFLRYMMDLGTGDDNYIGDSLEKFNPRCIHQRKEITGHFFKDQGADVSEGPYGYGDWSVFPSSCTTTFSSTGSNPPYTPLKRYEYTYGRKSYDDWGDHLQMKALIDDFGTIQNQVNSNVKQLIDKYLDMNLFLNYLVLLNWAGTWDQRFHNQFCHQRVTDGQWSWHPWDSDSLFGESAASNSDLYAGDTTQYHYLKKCVIQNFKNEINHRYRLLQATILDPTYLTKKINQIDRTFNRTQASLSPGGFSQTFPTCISNLKSWITNRYSFVQSVVGKWDTATSGDPWVALENVFCPQKHSVVRVFTSSNFLAVPGKPPLPEVRMVTDDTVQLDLYPGSLNRYNLLKYTIRFSSNNEPWSPYVSINVTSTQAFTFSHTQLRSLTSYTYQYRMVTSGGNSAWSDFLVVTTKGTMLGAIADNSTNGVSSGLPVYGFILIISGSIVFLVILVVLGIFLYRKHSKKSETF